MVEKSKEIRSLTGIRGVAAIYVAIYHSLENKDAVSNSALYNFFNHGYLSVDLFFILSGFVITLSSKKYFTEGFSFRAWLDFMKRRFARVYPMYFVTLVFGFVFLNHLDGKINFIIGLSMLSILYSPGWVMLHLWSLSAEWVAYLFYPFLLAFSYLKSKLSWTAIAVCCAFVVIFIYTQYNYLYTHGNPTSKGLTDVVKCFAEYVLGISAFKIVSSGLTVFKYQNAAQVLISFLMLALLVSTHTDFFVILLFFPLIILISNDQGWLSKVFSSRTVYFTGLISYSLYLIHPVFLFFFKKAYYENFESTTGNTVLFNVLYIAACIFTSYLTFTFIELPMQIFINNKFKKRLALKSAKM